MCGRYYIENEHTEEQLLEIIEQARRKSPRPVATGEIYPGNVAAVVANSRAGKIVPFAMRWGYQPGGLRGSLIINARSETAAEKPIFADGVLRRRCLVPASRYFEWAKSGDVKRKYAIAPKDAEFFAMAGIYRMDAQSDMPRFVILTREACKDIAGIHGRMPVILPEREAGDWLNIDNDYRNVIARSQESMRFYEVMD
ncbi:MAG: SOS response-associated peptidase [Clostridia bacterium]|nr:SOS response-associated peptidase [Clostridia bacterium]